MKCCLWWFQIQTVKINTLTDHNQSINWTTGLLELTVNGSIPWYVKFLWYGKTLTILYIFSSWKDILLLFIQAYHKLRNLITYVADSWDYQAKSTIAFYKLVDSRHQRHLSWSTSKIKKKLGSRRSYKII